MVEIFCEDFNEQVDEMNKVAIDNNEKYLEEQQLAQANNYEYNALKKRILTRITSCENETVTEKRVVQMHTVGDEKLNIKKSDGTVVGVMGLSHNFKEKVASRINVIDNKPIFTIYRGNEVYLEADIIGGRSVIHLVPVSTLKEVTALTKQSEPLINKTKDLYGLIESKQYSVLDKYITDCMVKILENADLNLSAVDINNLHTQLQVQYREIQRTKMEIASAREITEEHREMLKRLDNLYMVICASLINMGLDEIPNLDGEKITRS